jgi:small redox-active disulfide protein 2
MKIEVLGPGCHRCHETLHAVEAAVAELGIQAEIVYVNNFMEIMKKGVIATPAVAIDGDIKVCGSVPTVEDVKKMLQEGAG